MQSKECKKLISESVCDMEYDAGLVLKSGRMEGELSIKSFKKKFYRVFNLDNGAISTLSIPIQAACDEYISSNSSHGHLPSNGFISLVKTNIKRLLKEYLRLKVLENELIDDEELILLSASEENLMTQADFDDYLLQLKKYPGDKLNFQEVPPHAAFNKRDYLLRSKRKLAQCFKTYDKHDHEVENGSLFRSIDRIRLIYSMICSVIDIGLLKNLGIISYIPLANTSKLEILKNSWGSFDLLIKSPFKTQDLQPIREYFGESICIYFAWLEFLLKSLIPLSTLSIILEILCVFYSNAEIIKIDVCKSGSILLSIFLPVFSTFFEQFWIRSQKMLAWRWGTADLYQVEEQRPEFEGRYHIDEINGKMKKMKKPEHWIKCRRTISALFTLIFILITISSISYLFWYKSKLSPTSDYHFYIGIATALQIKLFNYIFTYLSTALNKWENHELPSQYFNSLALKLFLFQFVNSYISLFYIAFFKSHIEGCINNSCSNELKLQLSSIFITNFFLNIIELLVPLIATLKYKNLSKFLLKSEGSLTSEQLQSKSYVYDTPLSDYMEVTISYGYVILFGASFPLISVLLIMLVMLEIRVDAWKLCNATQRPYPEASSSIGIWLKIIQAMSLIGAGTNISIIVFTNNTFNTSNQSTQWLLFFLLENLIIAFKFSISLLISDTPKVIKHSRAWHAHILSTRLSTHSPHHPALTFPSESSPFH